MSTGEREPKSSSHARRSPESSRSSKDILSVFSDMTLSTGEDLEEKDPIQEWLTTHKFRIMRHNMQSLSEAPSAAEPNAANPNIDEQRLSTHKKRRRREVDVCSMFGYVASPCPARLLLPKTIAPVRPTRPAINSGGKITDQRTSRILTSQEWRMRGKVLDPRAVGKASMKGSTQSTTRNRSGGAQPKNEPEPATRAPSPADEEEEEEEEKPPPPPAEEFDPSLDD